MCRLLGRLIINLTVPPNPLQTEEEKLKKNWQTSVSKHIANQEENGNS
jgi:hypothetical protein